MVKFKEVLIEKIGSFTAWHGSGERFTEFSRTKAHTGEGGAAFGSGIYVSKNQKVGEFYQKSSKNPNATLYQIKVNIDTDKILRWDTPFSRQPKPVQDTLKTINYDGSKGTEARYYYHTLRASFSSNAKSGPVESEKATKYLEDLGLHGIYFVGDRKYQGPERDTSKNFVIFDPSKISIIQRFDRKGNPV